MQNKTKYIINNNNNNKVKGIRHRLNLTSLAINCKHLPLGDTQAEEMEAIEKDENRTGNGTFSPR